MESGLESRHSGPRADLVTQHLSVVLCPWASSMLLRDGFLGERVKAELGSGEKAVGQGWMTWELQLDSGGF